MMLDNGQVKDRRTVIMSEIMTPDKVNFFGFIHGGYILQILDRVAYACAARYSGKNVLTVSVDQVTFKEPINIADLVIFYASVNYVGTTSMEIGVRVIAENLKTGESRHTNTCYVTMVAVDEQGKPVPVKPLEILNETEQRRADEAKIRRATRLGKEKTA